jgi:hypothetical protein
MLLVHRPLQPLWGGRTPEWCQFRNYIHPLNKIDTKKKITRPPPFEGEQAGDPSTGQ